MYGYAGVLQRYGFYGTLFCGENLIFFSCSLVICISTLMLIVLRVKCIKHWTLSLQSYKVNELKGRIFYAETFLSTNTEVYKVFSVVTIGFYAY